MIQHVLNPLTSGWLHARARQSRKAAKDASPSRAHPEGCPCQAGIEPGRALIPIRTPCRFTAPQPRPQPRLCKTRLSRRARRGLGLIDVTLAIAVLSLLSLWGGQILGDWLRSQVVTGEVRTLADLARAGRLLIEGDIAHAGRHHPEAAAPISVPLADLAGAGLWSPARADLTPGRRALSLWLYRPSSGALLVIARARGERPLTRLPGAQDGVSGVGLMLPGETRLRGPGVAYDMAELNAALPGFATQGDLFAFDYVALGINCRAYLYRVPVPGCDANGDGRADAVDAGLMRTLHTDLDMNGHDLTNLARIEARTAKIGTLEGATTLTGDLTVQGDLTARGATDLNALSVTGLLTAPSVDVTGALTVSDLTATGPITGADITMTGTVTVSGEALLGRANAQTLTVETLNVGQLSSDRAEFREIFADDITATTCRGCQP